MSQFRISYSSGKWMLGFGALLLVLAAVGVGSEATSGLLFFFGGPLAIAGAILWSVAVARKR